jgi:hypothetical protein
MERVDEEAQMVTLCLTRHERAILDRGRKRAANVVCETDMFLFENIQQVVDEREWVLCSKTCG